MKRLIGALVALLVLPLVLGAAVLTLEDADGYSETVDVTGWIKGEDFCFLSDMYLYPWNGETTITYDIESGVGDLKVEGKIVGLMLLNKYTMVEPADTADIVTVNVTSQHLDKLSGFPNLLGVTIMFMREEVDFSRNLGRLKQLRALSITERGFGDEEIAQLEDLKELRFLRIVFTSVGDEGLKTIGGFTKLRELWLTGTPVTDAGLAHLTGLKNLRELWLNQTRVSREGVDELQKALPNCRIVF